MGQKNCKPQPGDLIEIDRPRHKHWALYMGDGYVIHLTDEGASSISLSSSSIHATRAKVKKELLKNVAKSSNWRVNNKYDCYHTPFPVKWIIQCAKEWFGKEVPYNVLTSNCEHFVTELRYGDALCEQLRTSAGYEIPIRDMTDEKDCPNPGDLIEIKKGSYAQWALYVGDGYVIHMTPVDENAAPLSASSVTIPIRKVKATKELLKEVVGKDDWAVNNKHDLYHTPQPVEEIIWWAEECIDMELPYDELGIYSEEFVTELRYGWLDPDIPLTITKSEISLFKRTSPRYIDPRPGDLIEIRRPWYQHWALCMGDGYVIHVTLEDKNDSSMSASIGRITAMIAKVKKQLLKEVAGNDYWHVNNKYDQDHTPFPVEEIIQRAEKWIDKVLIYNLFASNCEHFVTKLRYGKALCEQPKAALQSIKYIYSEVMAVTSATRLQ